MTSLLRRSALVICILAVGAQASAEVVLLSQSRSVYADGWVWPGIGFSDSVSAPDFGLFEEDVSAFGLGPWGSYAEGSATQDSEIQAGHFSIHGSASAYAETGSKPSGRY
jgi:hypothetical protein